MNVLQHSKQPLYQQLATVFRRHIESGLWARGARIPTLDALTDEFGVGRATVRAALGELEVEGLVTRARGQGSFVSAASTQADIRFNIACTWDDLVEFGKHNSLEVVTESAGAVLDLPAWCRNEGVAAEQYHRLERVYLRGDVRVCFSVVYLASDIYLKWQDRFKTRAIATVFGETPELALGQALQTLTIISAGDDTSNHLRIAVGSPIAEVIRRVYDPDRRLLYWSRVHFPSKYVRMEFELLAQPLTAGKC